jgi:MinD superfamily P-loop ATPase
VNAVREYARKAAEEFGFDTIIIDGPPGIGCPAISSVTGVDKVIIITEPTLSGFHDMKRILELTEGFSIKSYVIINKYDLNAAITEQIIDWCSRRKINVAGKLPFDEKIVEAMIRCKSIVEYMPDSQVSNEIRNSWKIINAEGS